MEFKSDFWQRDPLTDTEGYRIAEFLEAAARTAAFGDGTVKVSAPERCDLQTAAALLRIYERRLAREQGDAR